jgi:Holliday junction resolvasome RuvABC endonuclease subunit
MDLGTRMGVAWGVAGAPPQSCTVVLKKPSEPRPVAFSNLLAWLSETWTRQRPALVITEAPFSLEAFAVHSNAETTVRFTLGLHAIVEACCVRFGLPHEEVYVSTVRKHLLGKAKLGSREATKRAVVSRVQLLGLLPRDCFDADRADALAVWDWAGAHLARKPPRVLHFFGEAAE